MRHSNFVCTYDVFFAPLIFIGNSKTTYLLMLHPNVGEKISKNCIRFCIFFPLFFQIRSIHSAFNHNFQLLVFVPRFFLIRKWSPLDEQLHWWSTFPNGNSMDVEIKYEVKKKHTQKTVQRVHVVRKKCAHSEYRVLFDFDSFFFLLRSVSNTTQRNECDWKRQRSEHLYDSKRIYDAFATMHKNHLCQMPFFRLIHTIFFCTSAFVACDNDVFSSGICSLTRSLTLSLLLLLARAFIL